MHTTIGASGLLGQHQMVSLHQDDVVRCWQCTACGVRAVYHVNVQSRYQTVRTWIDWTAPDGRTWYTTPDDLPPAPSCPLPTVDAVCPWEDYAPSYDGAKGDVQLETAMRTWCERHQQAVSECTNPGPYCQGRFAHDEGEFMGPGPCTGREESCRCMCPSCCGDTPDMYSYDGDR